MPEPSGDKMSSGPSEKVKATSPREVWDAISVLYNLRSVEATSDDQRTYNATDAHQLEETKARLSAMGVNRQSPDLADGVYGYAWAKVYSMVFMGEATLDSVRKKHDRAFRTYSLIQRAADTITSEQRNSGIKAALEDEINIRYNNARDQASKELGEGDKVAVLTRTREVFRETKEDLLNKVNNDPQATIRELIENKHKRDEERFRPRKP